MSEQVIIYLPDPYISSDAPAQWQVVDQHYKAQGSVEYGTFAQAAKFTAVRRCHVIIGAEQGVLTEATVPGGSAKRAATAIPFALEDQFASDLEDIHFAIGTRQGSELFPVIGVDEQFMSELREQLTHHHLAPTRLMVDAQLLPYQAEPDQEGQQRWHALIHQDRFILRYGQNHGVATLDGDAPWMIKQLLQALDDEQRVELTVHYVGQRDQLHDKIPPHPQLKLRFNATESPLSLFTPQMNQSAINLLQGKHSFKEQLQQLWRPWRLTAALVAATGALWVGSQLWALHTLDQEKAQLESQMFSEVRSAFPNARLTADPVRDLRSRMRGLRAGGASSSLLPMLNVIASSKQQGADLSLNAVNLRDNKFDLDMTVENLAALEALKQSFEKSLPVTSDIRSATPQDGDIRGRMRLELK